MKRVLSLFVNALMACAVAAWAVYALVRLGAPHLDASLWEEMAVAADLRPPCSILPGLWRLLAGKFCAASGWPRAVELLGFVGTVLGAASAVLVFGSVRIALARMIRTDQQYPVWLGRIVPFFSVFAAVMFASCDSFSRLYAPLAPDGVTLFLFLMSARLATAWFATESRKCLFLSFVLMGAVLAETPLGVFVPPAFFAVRALVNRTKKSMAGIPATFSVTEKFPNWGCFFAFFAGLALVGVATVWGFARYGGISANGWRTFLIFAHYTYGHFCAFLQAASVVGWMLWLGFCLLPLVAAVLLLPSVLRDDRSLPFSVGIALFAVGVSSLLQCGAFPAISIWSLAGGEQSVESGLLRALCTLVAVVALAFVGAAFSMLAQGIAYPNDDGTMPRPALPIRLFLPIVAAVLAGWTMTARDRTVENSARAVVKDAIEETVRECAGAKWIFTDGRLDAALELAAKRNGTTLLPLCMMSGASRRETFLRMRGFDKGTDRDLAERGVPALLRYWAVEKNDGLSSAAVQLGFECWQRDRKKLPLSSGLVARIKWPDEKERLRGIAACEKLSERILELSPKVAKEDLPPALTEAFWAVSWRLSRFLRLRGEDKTAEALDLANKALVKVREVVERERNAAMMLMTPGESLGQALRKADFAGARRPALQVLEHDEDSPEANFALGMDYARRERYAEAEGHLLRCLVRRPEEPAVLNNLSVICRKQGKFDKAIDYARRALKRLPDSKEVKRSLADAEAHRQD